MYPYLLIHHLCIFVCFMVYTWYWYFTVHTHHTSVHSTFFNHPPVLLDNCDLGTRYNKVFIQLLVLFAKQGGIGNVFPDATPLSTPLQ